MSRAPVIARRELLSYFVSPVAYIMMALFLFFSAMAFWDDFQPGQAVEMRHLFEWMVVFLILMLMRSQAGIIGKTQQGRAFVQLINLNGENNYRMTLRARKRAS